MGWFDWIFQYHSVKFITVHNPKLALFNWSLQGFLALYVIIYTIILNKGYQIRDTLVGTVVVKPKGTGFVNYTNVDDPGDWIPPGHDFSDLVVYDLYDLVIPPQEPDSLFVATNFWKTGPQRRGQCAGIDSDELCTNCTLGYNPDGSPIYGNGPEECCIVGDFTDNGMKTGICVDRDGAQMCQIQGWCEPEDERVRDLNYVNNVENWTLFIKTNVRFPLFDIHKTTADRYDTIGDGIQIPLDGYNLFSVEDILQMAGHSLSETRLRERGAVILFTVDYECDFDKNPDQCNPENGGLKFGAMRLDADNDFSPGHNFRFVDKWSTFDEDLGGYVEERNLWKYYGVRFLFEVSGYGGKFDIAQLTYALGAGIALLSLATLACDFILDYLIPHHELYSENRYEDVMIPEGMQMTPVQDGTKNEGPGDSLLDSQDS